MTEAYDVVVVGCGLSGCVMAERLANVGKKKVLIIDKRDHIGGNCYDYVDDNGILINKYGAHLFHTNHADVWEYVNKFGTWERWDHEVKGLVDGKMVPIPVNITTVNTLFNLHLRTEVEMDAWLLENQVKYDDGIKDGEQMAKSRVGEALYTKIFKTYTFKQWNKYPHELDGEVLARIPVRNNHDPRYFSDRYQALPKEGYTKFFESLLEHPNIDVWLNCDYNSLKQTIDPHKLVIFTGPIDYYFADSGHEKLEYRSIDFVMETHKNMEYYQPNSVVNYPQDDVKFTRIVEYKHFLHQKSPHTTIVKEFTCDGGEPYYPVLNEKNRMLYQKYQQLAELETKNKNVHFIGRLANYRYFNMDQAIKNALEYFEAYFADDGSV